MASNLIQDLEYIAKQRGMDKDEMLTLLTESVQQAARKAVRNFEYVDATIDPRRGGISCTARLIVVDNVTYDDRTIELNTARTRSPNISIGNAIDWPIIDDDGRESTHRLMVVKDVTTNAREIELKTALTLFPSAKVGQEINWPVKTEDFGRIAAQAAKQVITNGLQSAEKRHVVEIFKDRVGQLLNGTVTNRDKNGTWINFGQADGLMPPKWAIPGEVYDVGEPITVLLKELNPDKAGASLYVSRNSPDLVRRLFEREVSEISDGTVVIKNIAREAGYRTKIAVWSEQPKVDPVGACVGVGGARVRTIVSELGGEKVDIINWSDDIKTYVANALKPAKLVKVMVDEQRKKLEIRVADDQLSLSIGKKGQNSRLAAKLLGWNIDIKRVEKEAEEDGASAMQAQIQQAISLLENACGIDEATAETLVGNGYHSIEGLREATMDDLLSLEGISPEIARRIFDAVREEK